MPGGVPEPMAYQPFWCEENIWHLAQHPATVATERLVLVLTGAQAEVACWQQTAAGDEDPILWDYHVLLAARSRGWRIWDLDSRLGHPVPAQDWLRGTFPCPALVRPPYQPRCACIPAGDYIRDFGSDRAHMRRADGGWQRPPPPWPAIAGQGLSLSDAILLARRGLDLAALRARLESSTSVPRA